MLLPDFKKGEVSQFVGIFFCMFVGRFLYRMETDQKTTTILGKTVQLFQYRARFGAELINRSESRLIKFADSKHAIGAFSVVHKKIAASGYSGIPKHITGSTDILQPLYRKSRSAFIASRMGTGSLKIFTY